MNGSGRLGQSLMGATAEEVTVGTALSGRHAVVTRADTGLGEKTA